MNAAGGFGWEMPVAVSFGAGCADELPAALGERRAIVLAFEAARSWPLAERWRAALGTRLVAWVDVADGLSDLAGAPAPRAH